MSFVTTIRALARAEATEGALDVALELVRGRARRLVPAMERAWAAGRTSPDQGLAIAPGEVERLLNGEGEDAREPASLDPALARDPLWSRLRAMFALGDAELDFLALLAAVEADPDLRRVVAYLHDDTRRDAPTPILAARLAGRPQRIWRAPNLLRWRLAAPVEDACPHALTSGWRIDPALMAAIDGGAWDDPILGEAVRLIAPAKADRTLPLQDAATRALAAASDLGGIELTGPPGIGRETVALRHAAARREPLLVADLPALSAQGLSHRDAIVRVLRFAAFAGALAYFRDADEVPALEWMLARAFGRPFLRGTRVAVCGDRAIALAPLPLGDRRSLWRSLSAAPCPAVVVTQRLTPAEIVRLACTPDAPRKAARTDHALLATLPCPYDWDDLVLPSDIAAQLRELVAQIRHRWEVQDGWGYAHLAHLGSGIAALFGGPSGTGKTMAAQVVARDLGLDLVRVDLAGVVNKYVGETEKKLREVFDACEDSGALLFFDEADSLFGGRMQVKDAHDRFANIETNYLLQRIETFDGVAILATNRRDEIDEAFQRRLRFIVDFLPPQPAERLTLWRRALRPTSPAGEPLLGEIDWTLLAEKLPMTGAAIKNTALSAAFLACAQGQPIGMGHLLHAARRELAKHHETLPIALREGDGR